MDSVDLQVFKSAYEWQKAGHRVVLVTVVRTWGSAPRPIGALTAIRDDGMLEGSVSGGLFPPIPYGPPAPISH